MRLLLLMSLAPLSSILFSAFTPPTCVSLSCSAVPSVSSYDHFFSFRCLLVTLRLLFAVLFVSSSALPYTSTSVSSSALFLLLGLFQVPSPRSFVSICVFSSTSYSSLSLLFFRWLLWRVRHSGQF